MTVEDTQESGAMKLSAGEKLPVHLMTPEMVDALAEGLKLGQDKGYPARNWEKGLPLDEVSISSAIRHINKWRGGEDFNVEINPSTGEELAPVHHLVCALTNIGMAITQIKRGRVDLDDRPNRPEV